MTTISLNELEDLCRDLLLQTNLRDAEREETLDHFLENEYSGKSSHGVIRILEAYNVLTKEGATPPTNPKMEIDNGAMLTLNAQRQIGTVAGRYLSKTAVIRAKTHGIAMLGIHNYIGSAGSMAYYLRRMTEEKIIAIMGCNSIAMVAPPEGIKPTIGTNPIGIGIPSHNGDAMIADLATTELAYGKIALMKEQDLPIPEGLIIDRNGMPSTDPEDATKGAMLPLAGFKGFALGLMVEMLSAFIGATPHSTKPYNNNGLFIIAIDPTKMGGEHFLKQMDKTLGQIRNASPASEDTPVSIPGDRSARTLEETLESGHVEVAQSTLDKIYNLLEK